MNKIVELSEFEKKIIDILQTDFPLTEKPFEEIGKILSLPEKTVIKIINNLKKNKIIRQIGAIYNTEKMDFKSSLIAFNLDNKEIDIIAEYINRHPGVSHNYKRDNKYNLWFTFAVPNKYDINKQILKITKKYKIRTYLILPKIKTFKRKVVFKLSKNKNIRDKISLQINSNELLFKNHNIKTQIMQELQNDMIISPTPFKYITDKYSITFTDLSNFIKKLKANKILVRYSAIIKNQNIGYTKNAMVVWNVPGNQIENFGKSASKFELISHCYLRRTYSNWKYNIYTMIHGKTEEQNNIIINNLKNEFNINDYKIIYSLFEYKKQRINYFSNEYKNWN